MPLFAAYTMKKRLLSGLMLLVLCCVCFLSSASAATTYGTVTGGWLRLRSSPSYEAETITSYRSGSRVIVLGVYSGWCKVQTSDNRVGYMDSRYLILSQEDDPVVPRVWTNVNKKAWITSVNGLGVRLRNAPVVNSTNVLGLYPIGRTVTVYKESDDGWSYIKIDQKYGYMMTKFLADTGTDTLTPISPVYYPTVTEPIITSSRLTSISLNITSPRVGDLLSLSLYPASSTCQYVWYREDNRLLSTGSTYLVQAADAGYIINVHVSGTGVSAGVSLDASTERVSALSRNSDTTVSSPAVTTQNDSYSSVLEELGSF